MSLLHKLGLKYRTDKVDEIHTTHYMSYCDIYDRYFYNIRHNVKKFVEIGVKDGCSLRMWQEYFPNATIYGVDIDPRCKRFEEDRIKIFIGDQNDDNFLLDLKEAIGEYDILLDDGSHITRHQIKTFNYLYENSAKNGFYIIEDLRNSYEHYMNHHNVRQIWPGMIYNKPEDDLKNYRKEFVEFVEDKVKELDFHTADKMFSIHYYPMIVIFQNM